MSPRTSKRSPQNHRTIDRVTAIIEEVVYQPGMTFAELVRAVGAARSSVYGFIQGLLAQGWLYEDQNRFYLGPAVYSLTLASGHIRAGSVTHADLETLHAETGVTVFVGVQAGDHLIYIADAGVDHIEGFEARSNIRRIFLDTAAGKAILAAQPETERMAYLRRRGPDEDYLVDQFLEELPEIQHSGIATNIRRRGTRFAIATVIRNHALDPVAAVTLVGARTEVEPRAEELANVLLKHVEEWSTHRAAPREAI